MYSTQNDRKSVASERFIRTIENNIYKHLPAVSKNAYIDKLENFVDKYNNTYHRTIKMKLADVKSGNYIKYIVNSNDKFQVGDNV